MAVTLKQRITRMAKAPTPAQTEEQKAAAKAAREAEKAAKFVELANKRVPKALDAIALLRGLGNKNNYTSSPEHVTAIMKALEDAVVKVGNALKGTAPASEGFALPVPGATEEKSEG